MIEAIAVIFSLLSVYLGARNNILTWPLGILGIITYSILFYQNNIFGNMALQPIFLIQSIYGWLKWNDDKKITKLSSKKSQTNISFCIIISIVITYILYMIGSSNPVMDGITTGLSIIALILMSYRKLDSWYYWIIADTVFVLLFIRIHLYMSAATYFLFLILAIWGLRKWSRSLKTD